MSKDIAKILVAVLVVAAIYDIFVKAPAGTAVNLTGTVFKGGAGVLARLTGGSPPSGF